MSSKRSWFPLTVVGPAPDEHGDMICLSNPLLKRRVLINHPVWLQALAHLYRDSDEATPAVVGHLEMLGFLTDTSIDPQWKADIAHWEGRGWGPALDYYLWSRNCEYSDLDQNPETLRDNIRRQLNQAPPPTERSFPGGISLAAPEALPSDVTLGEVMIRRKSVRKYSGRPVSQAKLSAILWYGLARVRQLRKLNLSDDPIYFLRSYGSAFDAYLVVYGVDELEPGVHWYDIRQHTLAQLSRGDLRMEMREILFGMRAPLTAAWTLVFVVDFERYAWRYRHERALRNLYIEAGRIAHETILAGWAMNVGSVPTPATRDRRIEALLQLEEGRQSVVYTVTFGDLPGPAGETQGGT